MIHRVMGGKGVSGSPFDPDFWDPAGRFEFKARGRNVEQSQFCLSSKCPAFRPVPIFHSSFPSPAQLVFYRVCQFTSRMLIRNKRLTDALCHTGLLFQVTMDRQVLSISVTTLEVVA
jgi:hypothetical protein